MYLWYDTKNRKECISDHYIGCKTCDSCWDCTHSDCENYDKYIKGYYIYHTGDIGSALIGLISLDIKELRKQITDLCMPYIRNEINDEIDIDNWIDSFSNIKKYIGKFYDIFCLVSPLSSYYWRYVSQMEQYSSISRKKQSFKYSIKHEFFEFECILAYINSCINDETFYDVKKYEFANRYYFEIDHKLSSFELDTIDLNYNTPYGRRIVDFNTPQAFIKDLNKKYQTEKKERDERFKIYDKVYEIDRLSEFARISLSEILKAGYKFKKCENCGVAFIPYNRSDAIYCDHPSPQDNTKLCKEYGARKAYQNNLNSNKTMKLYRNIYMQKQMLAKRNPDIKGYTNEFENFKEKSKQWKKEVKAGLKVEDEYLSWLKSIRKKDDD